MVSNRLGPMFTLVLAASCAAQSGCMHSLRQNSIPAIVNSGIPTELEKMSSPTYRVEPPDILIIEAVNNIRPPEDPLRAGDELVIRVSNTIPPDPMADPISNEFKIINGPFRVQSNGTVDLGPEYGSVVVAGLTPDGARDAIVRHLIDFANLVKPQVAISMSNVRGKQEILGEHLVRPDGTVSLGIYGSVYVAGMTLEEVKLTIQDHLATSIHNPEVQVDVQSYNSKVYYVITDGGGYGEQVVRLPFTGNETVLDAVAQIQGLSDVSSKEIWIARPAPPDTACAQTLPVDWRAITQEGITSTNYQLYPGDRIYIKADRFITFDSTVAKAVAPFERIFGFILLGNGTVRALQQGSNGNQGGFGNNNGGF